MKKTVKDLIDIKGKKVLVRVDFNVPLDDNGNITDDTRIKSALPTVNYLRENGAKVIIVSHLGRPKGEVNEKYTLAPVSKRLAELINAPVAFLKNTVGSEALENDVNNLKEGEVALLENIRFYPAEEKPDKDPEFAKKLAALADIYVNDAFGAAHRSHSSTAVITKYVKPSVSGLLMEKELSMLGKLLEKPERPFIAVIGGSKVSTKIGVLENLMDKVDALILGGGMTYTFMKAQGYSIGNSIVEDDKLDIARDLMKVAKEKNVGFLLAKDVVVADQFSNEANTRIVASTEISDGWEGIDIGPDTREEIRKVILNAKTILWNGPVGVFEIDKFSGGTHSVAQNIADATKHGAISVLGGGDTVAAIEKFHIAPESYSHISTGGGASLEFIEGKELPGVAALDDK
ncbi:MAG: phosphoglycerate kinase [Candidatus Gastranaerophilales bacterium]|nr:phosphoglycerate kinase [Candidatus Gastranaerophilales bacterium]